ncbi:gp27 [Streptococcus pneumoniae]|nr:gp27 [Streptococcus pneumoniae]
MRRFIAIWILVSAGLNIWHMDRIRDLEEKNWIDGAFVKEEDMA